ncbi:glutathione peroxidase [Chromobacterium sp. Panama]|uniref:glutathione peroxidase n=1 Tax=Chromobacterium sp. Panama TaxID=2161826 RepID=UPI000D2F6313|nr:glutathione peroxidase [Chromobacterium sp. Panama]PTU64292.1 glutathione peroxidase [Chromobacterium sp. Panama]
MPDIYDFSIESLNGQTLPLASYRGKVLLLVNTASECGFTAQLGGLEQLYQRYREQGLEIIGFPCNQFGGQEPGDAAAIGQFCQKNFGVSFPLSAKIDVNGADAHPLWRHLVAAKPGLLGSRRIKWNFTKFLVDGEGRIRKRFAPYVKPAALERAIETLLRTQKHQIL